MITWIIVGACLLAIYYYLKSVNAFWKNKNVPQTNPVLFFGDMLDALLTKRSFGQIFQDIYQEHNDCAYVGMYKMRTPSILVRDPELVQKVLVSNFQSFHDNEFFVDEKEEPLFGKNPFFTRGSKWKTTRNQILPCFSSGKMKSIFPIMQNVSQRLVKYIEEKSGDKDGLETKPLSVKFTTENVINCSFGIEPNCFTDDNSDFLVMSRKIFATNISAVAVQIIILLFPFFTKILNVKFIAQNITDYFKKIVNEIVSYRTDNAVKRNDFIDILLEIKAKSKDFSDEDVAAHAFGLFVDGTETSGTAMSFILFHLAANLEAQAALRNEIDEIVENNNITYETIVGLPYLDAVINESLRLHPPLNFNVKLATEEFSFPPAKTGCDPVTVKPGTPIVLSYGGFHMDKLYYKDPKIFDPERFLGERKKDIVKCTHLPFGDGPRTCLGQRFAMVQMKVAIFNIIQNFELRVNDKTIQPIQIDMASFLMSVKGGMWVNFHKRK